MPSWRDDMSRPLRPQRLRTIDAPDRLPVHRSRAVLLVACVLLAGCRPAAAPPVAVSAEANPPLEFASSIGIEQARVVYDNGEAAGRNSILESLGGGVGLIDFDQDDRIDLCFPGGGRFEERSAVGLPTRLLRQVGVDRFEDVSERAGIAAPGHYSHGCAAADHDNDGFCDLLITGYGGVTLWRNQGDGTFVDATAAADLQDRLWSSSAGWGDLTGDGVLDLYVAHYVDWSFENDPPCRGPTGNPDVCPPRQFDGLDDLLYVGNGDGTFRDASQSAGLSPGGKGLGVILADLDEDGDNDVYVANDTVPNFLYVNDGHGVLEESGLARGVALDDMATPNGSMGVALTDYDADGWPDLWVTNYEDELFGLYRNLGDGNFLHASRRAGMSRIGTLFVGFGCVAGDFDGDGREDMVVANGHVVHHPRNAPVRQQPLLMQNRGQGEFARWSAPSESYFGQSWIGRGLATADVDRDGSLDLVFVNTNDRAALLYNRSAGPAGSLDSRTSAKTLSVRLIGRSATRDPLGARAELQTTGGNQLRCLSGGSSYLSTSELRLHWRIPAGVELQRLTVAWPGGMLREYLPEELGLSREQTVTRITLVEPD